MADSKVYQPRLRDNRLLAKIVQPHHCRDVLDSGYVANGFVYVRAGVAFALLFWVLFSLVRAAVGIL